MAKGQRPLLSPEDEARLKHIAETETDVLQKRARAILAWHEGLTAAQTAKRAQLTVNQVQYLWRIYRRKGLDLFMIDDESRPEPAPSAIVSEPEPDTAGVITLEALCAHYNVDLAHARHVGALSLQIFDATINVHRLPQNDRPLLEAAALVHNIAYELDPPNHHLRGRDILMTQPLRNLNDDERRILACTTSFHRKKVRPEAEPVYMELPDELRRDALALSAILRVGDGLDYSQTQTTEITDVQLTPEEVVISVEGPHAQSDAEQAQKKADLWNRVFPARVRVARAESEPKAAPVLRSLPAPAPPLDSAMTVTQVGRAFALHRLERIDALLNHARAGDVGLLASLVREASRLADAITLASVKGFRKEMLWFATAVEEAHVAVALAERAATYGDEAGDSAVSLVEQVEALEAEALALVQALDVERYGKLAANLRAALSADDQAEDNALIAYHAGPVLWEQLAALRKVMEHGESVSEALDAVRRLQNYLMAFRDLLGPEVAQALDMLAPLESYLTALQTTQAVLARLEPKTARKGRKQTASEAQTALEALRQAQLELLDMLADNLPAVWTSVNSPVFRRSFALAIAAP